MHYDTRNNLWVSSTDNGAKQKNILITTAGANRGVSHFEAFFLGGVGEEPEEVLSVEDGCNHQMT